MFRTAMRNLLAQKGRLLMTVLAVVLGVAFVAGTLIFTDTTGEAYKKQAFKSLKDVSVSMTPPYDNQAGQVKPFSAKLVDNLRELPGVADVTASVTGFTAVSGKDGSSLGGRHESNGANYFPGTDGKDDRYPLAAGRGPVRPGEIALDSHTANEAGYKVGDTVRVAVDGPVMQRTVVGIFHTDDGNVTAGGTLVLFDNATAQKLFATPGHYAQITLKAAQGASEAELAARAEKIAPKGTEVTTGSRLKADETATAADDSSGFARTLLVFAAIALFVGAFVIANTFTMLVTQRTRELALLRAVGASRRQVTRSVIVEALLLGAFASAAGFALGIGVVVILRQALTGTGTVLPAGPLVLTTRVPLASLAIGVGVTVLSAYLPARRAAKVPPMAAMSSVHAPPSVRSLVVRNTLGTLLCALGALTVLYTMQQPGVHRNANLVLVGAGTLMVGVFVLAPTLTTPVIGMVTPLLSRLGVPGRLALRNARRNPRRTASTASALMIGLSLITGLTTVGVSVSDAMRRETVNTVKADFTISMANGASMATSVDSEITSIPEVTASSPMRGAVVKLEGAETNVTGVDVRTIGRLVSPRFEHGSLDALRQYGGRALVAPSSMAESAHWQLGQTLSVVYGDGTRDRLRIGGLYKSTSEIGDVLVPLTTLRPHLQDAKDISVLVRTATGRDEKTRLALRHALGDNPAMNIQTPDDIAAANGRSDINALLNILYGLLAMAVVIAVLGVVNTLILSVLERSREIGMLRAVGLERTRVRGMIRLESLLISLFGTALGIGLGVFFGWAAGAFIRNSINDYEMLIPWNRIALFVALAGVVGVLAAVWPARRAANMNVLTAVKAE